METTFYQNLLEEEKKTIAKLEAIRLLIGSYKESTPNRVDLPSAELGGKKLTPDQKQYFKAVNSTPEKYSPDLSQLKKVFWGIRHLKSATANQVAEYLSSIDGKGDFKDLAFAKKRCSYHLSKFGSLKIISAVFEDGKNTYSIK